MSAGGFPTSKRSLFEDPHTRSLGMQQDVLSLPLDVLRRIIASALATGGAPALQTCDALSLTNKAFTALACEDCIMALLAENLGIPSCSWLLVRAACRADELLALKTSYVTVQGGQIHVTLAKCKGWLSQLTNLLLSHGLVSIVSSIDELVSGKPFGIVYCDARSELCCHATAELTHISTYPCASSRCLSPAARGCLHCGKHGGSGAKTDVKRMAAIISTGRHPLRRVVFVASSEPVLEAYQQALRSQS